MSAIDALQPEREQRLREFCAGLRRIPLPSLPPLEGRLVRVVGNRLEAEGCRGPVGSRMLIIGVDHEVEAEVVGFSEERLILMPEGAVAGLMVGARVRPMGFSQRVDVDVQLLGRILDGRGQPLDGRPRPRCRHHRPLRAKPLNPLTRSPVREVLDVGVRAINGLLTVGRGQRMLLMAGSGLGKSTLLGMMTRHSRADVIVVCLIGERGREVREFVEDCLGPAGLKRAVVVATPADDPPLTRVHAAWRATAIAEFFRDQGNDVLLLMDSLTRFAQAQREIGLAAGEPPVTKGYTPSVFSLLPALVERVGNTSAGSLTALYTVLVEGDDPADPIADAAKAIADGHIVLSRELADAGVYPPIDPERSISRCMSALVDARHQDLMRGIRALAACYTRNRDLIAVGAYKAGADRELDQAVRLHAPLLAYLRQLPAAAIDMNTSRQELELLHIQSQQQGAPAE
jgi:flagellum-specific ATP synthase